MDDHPPLSPRAQAITGHLLMHGPSTRAALCEAFGLSEASMSRVVRIMADAGIVTEESERTSIGRPRQILTAVPESRHVVGIKLTGDTAYGVLCDLAGEVITSLSLPLPARAEGIVPVEGVVRVIGRLVRRLGKSVDGVGISLGGVVDGRSVVRDGPFLGWRDVDLGERVSRSGGVPAVLSNDVVALAREQLWFGAGRTHDTFGVITVGAGLGFAVVREGIVLEHLIDNGHLLSHSPVDSTGPACRLGHHGCVAGYLDRDAVAARFGLPGADVTFEQLATLDPSWFTGAATALGHLIATVAGGLQTERIVLAGEDVGTLYASPVTATTLELRLGPAGNRQCELTISTEPLGFEDWARGAGVVGIQALLGAL
ncbi:ROK family transcriptional regulator [Kineosporia mesophila]|uniref:ROK family transcriptional regulator n=1 Tax=Kineosporia mesophila TaxID=566012 RepID=A0ABP7ACJ2_9ACTN|nr:ROK family transcriptional regulator [Kineosporia mesophila]MCD5351267.1 ROK family transcriptional regulator [Kineosporia mesophila]